MTWFEAITGFREGSYEETQARLRIEGSWLCSDATDRRFAVGSLETPTLAELRQRAGPASPDGKARLRVACVEGDARVLHSDRVNRAALFQVASQFNLLEMVGPDVTPEHGVTRYVHDRTQGPACAIAAGAGTIYRNYLIDLPGGKGQRSDRQVDCLSDLGLALGNQQDALWEMRNGYALCTAEGLRTINDALALLSEDHVDRLRGLLRIGVHRSVQVTDSPDPAQLVSQAYCSALPVAYSRLPARQWERFATLVLEALYEATLIAGILNAAAGGSNKIFLTRVGGGAFGNDLRWINSSIARALRRYRDADLDVRIVCFGQVPPDVRELVVQLQSELRQAR